MVTSAMAPSDGYAQSNPSHRQRLTWKLSRRTLKQLRPIEKLVNVLPTIEENRQFGQVQNRSRCSRLTPHKMRLVSPVAVLSSLPHSRPCLSQNVPSQIHFDVSLEFAKWDQGV